LVQEQPGKCWIAVAFFGKDAGKLVPLNKGSTLVVNLAKETLQAGLTNPSELERLVAAGVDVYNNPDLDAKVFVFPRCAIIGSANATRNSANNLVEAAIEVADEGTIRNCRKFVRSLCQDGPIGPEYLEQLNLLYRPPSSVGPPVEPEVEENSARQEAFWVVPLDEIEYDRFDKAAEDRGLPKAEAELVVGPYSVETFCTFHGNFRQHVARNDTVTQFMTDGAERVAYPPARVLHLEHYAKKDDPSEWVMVFVEAHKEKESKNLGRIIWELKRKKCPNAESLRLDRRAWRLKDLKMVDAFRKLWLR
jgi:hypothetical protein